jgi:hypothetical protein
LDNLAELAQDYDGLVSLLEASSHDLELNLLLVVNEFKVRTADVKVARQQDLDGSQLGVNSNLALQSDGHAEDLTGVRHTDIRLKAKSVVETSLDEVGTSQAVLHDGDAALLDVALGHADSLVFQAELRQKTRVHIPLEKARLQMDVADKFTAFKERVHCLSVAFLGGFHFRNASVNWS